MTKKTKKTDELSILFPSATIQVAKDKSIEVRPLTLEDFPKVTNTLASLFAKFQQIRENQSDEEIPSNIELVKIGMNEIIRLIPYCVSEPDLSKIPVSVLPEILNKIIELNFTQDTLKNWTTLFETVAAMLPKRAVELGQVGTTTPDKSQ